MEKPVPIPAVIDRATGGGKDRKELPREIVREIREALIYSLLNDGLSPVQISQFVQTTPLRVNQLSNAWASTTAEPAPATQPIEAEAESTDEDEDDEETPLALDRPPSPEPSKPSPTTHPQTLSKRLIAKLRKRYGPGGKFGESPEASEWLATLEPTPQDESPQATPTGEVMSIVTLSGERVDPCIDKAALAIRDEIAQLSAEGLREFAVNLFRTCDVKTEKIAKALRCSEVTVRRVPETKWASKRRKRVPPSTA